MPRYHFHIHDGISLPDHDGTDLRDLAAARTVAVQTAGELLKSDADAFWSGTEWRMDVADASGSTLFTLSFTASPGPDAP